MSLYVGYTIYIIYLVIDIDLWHYRLINGTLVLKNNYDGHVSLIFLEKRDTSNALKYLHDEPIGRHFSGDTTTHKILRFRCYW